MNQIVRVAFAAALAAAPLLAQAPGRQKLTVGDAEVRRVHRSAILIDTHNDIPSDPGTDSHFSKRKMESVPIHAARRRREWHRS